MVAQSIPRLIYLPDGYEWVVDDYGLRFQFRGVYSEKAGLHSELQILKDYDGEFRNVYWADLNLSAQRSKTMLANLMAKRVNTVPDWEALVEMLCHKTANEFRKPSEAVWIGDTEQPPITYRLWPIAPMGEPSMIFGEGGSGKSYLALVMCVAIHFGIQTAGLVPTKGRVMYVDYETSQDIMERRVRKIARSLGLPLDAPMLLYYRGTQSLVKELASIKSNISNNDIDHLIIDSASLAVGGKLEDTEAVGAMFAGLRSLNIASTLISHVAKNAATGAATPFGSAYWRNFTRSEWQVVGAQEEGSNRLSMMVRHSKVNDEGKHTRLGFEFVFDDDAVRITAADVDKLPGLELHAPIKLQIRDAILAQGGTATIKEIAAFLEISAKSVESTISRNPTSFVRAGKVGKSWLYGVGESQLLHEEVEGVN